MLRTSLFALVFIISAVGPAVSQFPEDARERVFASTHDMARMQDFAERDADWRNGAVVYQVIVDRFVEPANLEERRHFFEAPRRLRSWDEEPRRGVYLPEVEVWSHEIDFWGGDLQGVLSRIDWLEELGIDVLYLNPIHPGFTNHKYDSLDYFGVSPEFGTREDVIALAQGLQARGKRLVLDGVFNHMGRNAEKFQSALNDPESPWRDWFFIGDQFQHGYRAWVNVANLPEVNLENPEVRARLYGDPDSVVQGWLRDGVDGWRLDVAFDMGFTYLGELTRAAHRARPGSVVIGEIWNYPEEWSPAVDGVMSMTLRELLLALTRDELSPTLFGRHVERMIADTGIGPILKGWLILDNHDTPRLTNLLPTRAQQRNAMELMFALPGSPVVYYGTELGMTGGDDPEQRGPMRWDLVSEENEVLNHTRRLIEIRRQERALRIGDFRLLDSDHLLAFLRRTDRVAESIFVIANPTDEPRRDVLMIRDSKIMSFTRFEDLLSDRTLTAVAGAFYVDLPPRTVALFKPVIEDTVDYSPYKRVR